jgi:hypothetical protein
MHDKEEHGVIKPFYTSSILFRSHIVKAAQISIVLAQERHSTRILHDLDSLIIAKAIASTKFVQCRLFYLKLSSNGYDVRVMLSELISCGNDVLRSEALVPCFSFCKYSFDFR